MPLARLHPNLFRVIMGIAGVNIVMAALLLSDSPERLINFRRLPEQGIVPPLSFWAIMFGIAGIAIIYGALKKGAYKWARRGLIVSAAVGGFWAFGFTLQYFAGTILGISGPLLWSFYTYIAIAATNEPALNPLSAALQQDIHKTLHDSSHTDGASNERV